MKIVTLSAYFQLDGQMLSAGFPAHLNYIPPYYIGPELADAMSLDERIDRIQ